MIYSSLLLNLQSLLEPDAAHAVENLLPQHVNGDLSALCVWPDQVRHWYRYRWTSPLHFIDTPDDACTYEFSSKFLSVIHFWSWESNSDTAVTLCLVTWCRGLPWYPWQEKYVYCWCHPKFHLSAFALQRGKLRSPT